MTPTAKLRRHLGLSMREMGTALGTSAIQVMRDERPPRELPRGILSSAAAVRYWDRFREDFEELGIGLEDVIRARLPRRRVAA